MSEPRVLPTEPGWWWVKWYDEQVIAEVVRVDVDESDPWMGVRDGDGFEHDTTNNCFNWLRPVPSREAVEAAAPMIRKLIDGLDEHWKTTSEGQAVIRDALQLVAGLTGKGGV